MPLGQTFGLALYLISRALFLKLGIKVFNGIFLRFNKVTILLQPDFPSGLRFVLEILDDDPYATLCEGVLNDSVMLDIGANIGLVSLQQSAKYPGLEFYCIEPHPHTYNLLRSNILANRLEDKVSAFHGAVSDSDGFMMINVEEDGNMAYAGEIRANSKAKEVKVKCWRIDDFCETNQINPNYIKIDVEGHEVEALKGGINTLREAKKVVVECHSDQLLADCRLILEDCGFSCNAAGGLLFGSKVI